MDEEDFRAYASLRWTRLVRAAAFLGNDREQAEELAQDVLLKVYLSWDKVMGARSPDAYVNRILLNASRQSSRARRRRGMPYVVLPETATEDCTSNLDTSVVLREAIRRLRRQHRELIALRFYAELSLAEISEVLGIPEGTTKSRLSRALDALSMDQALSAAAREMT
ncbi:hypothetical protein NLS1_35320 [Nocardioides sp. LS1]|nr:hypothetical protein NLS1_35320 [Nocardioides sp. LS1]